MKTLTYANWKQKLPFDNIVYKDVKRHSLKLNSYERAIMDTEIEFYRNRFSLLQVMNQFKVLKTAKFKETFIKAVLKRQDNILYIPHCLVGYFKNKIKTEFAEYKAFFEIMLDHATHQSNKNPLIPMIKQILGAYYKPVLHKLNHHRKSETIRVRGRTLPPAGYENTARNIIAGLQNNVGLSHIYGRSNIRKTVPISIVDDYGYGEWVSKNVSFNTNRLFIYSNHNKLTDVQLEHMIYFNVYPGYGYFYNTVADGEYNICFDNGATFLINGWAMYAMCHSKNSAYSSDMMYEGANIVHHLLKKNLDKGCEDAYVFLLGRYPKDKAINYMLDYTQYPGHYMSYILGALATEEAINHDFAHNPVDYLNTLKTINCGDFFALYHPKMQRKIAKNHITARVGKKFSN
ncbi:MAG: hypothetical protein E7356_03165 [Clostridiales bacterium]|nr:hypothetical protein [Clostridiales bacterium]